MPEQPCAPDHEPPDRDVSPADVAADYQQLLSHGVVKRDLPLDKHPSWRRAIKTQARNDKLAIRTRSYGTANDQPFALASLIDRLSSVDDLVGLLRRLGFVSEDGEPDWDAYREWMDT
jgi:hypothetical protein